MKIVGTAIIFNDDGQILIGQRPEGKDLAGLWEFPGGKLEYGETVEQCIMREIKEELNVDCEVQDFLLDVVKGYKHGVFKLSVFKARIKNEKKLKALEHQAIKWVGINELNDYEFPPADVEIIEFLIKNF